MKLIINLTLISLLTLILTSCNVDLIKKNKDFSNDDLSKLTKEEKIIYAKVFSKQLKHRNIKCKIKKNKLECKNKIKGQQHE